MIPRIVRQVRHLLGIDRAVGFTVLGRSWSILSGTVTILLIARFLSLPEQGYYYTFYSLVSLQVVFELGFSYVILQLAAHESSELQISPDGTVLGSEVSHSRLASILQKSMLWYSVVAVLMALGLILSGFHFFSAHHEGSDQVGWKIPWLGVVLAATLTFPMDPVFSFLEGCGLVANVAKLRFGQTLMGTSLAWIALTAHRGLFAPAAMILGQAIAGFVFLCSKRTLLIPLLRRRCKPNVVGWRHEIWPFQWRIAVTCMSTYLVLPLFSPVLFAYRGPTEAGRMGMSLNIATALLAVASAWINTKSSPFGTMVSRGDYAVLDRVFFRTLVQSAVLLLGGQILVIVCLPFAAHYFPRLANRLMPVPLFGLLMLATFLSHIAASEAAYLRAHKREPFLLLSISVGILTGISTLIAARYWGITGVVIGYLCCGGIFYLAGGTFIFTRCRQLWHSDISASDSTVRECI